MISPVILKNKGVPVTIIEVANGVRVTDSEGALKLSERFVQFTNNSIIDLEERFGTLEEFQKQLEVKPRSTIRAALGFAWEVDERVAGQMMVDDQINEYATGVGVALAIANGLDPTQAAEMFDVGISATKELAKARDGEAVRMLAEARREIEQLTSPGSNGSAPGSAPDVPSTSSGA